MAQAVEDEELVSHCDHKDERVIECPSDLADVFTDKSALTDRVQIMNLVWIELFSVIMGACWPIVRLCRDRLGHLGVMALLSIDREGVLVLPNYIQVVAFETLLL